MHRAGKESAFRSSGLLFSCSEASRLGGVAGSAQAAAMSAAYTHPLAAAAAAAEKHKVRRRMPNDATCVQVSLISRVGGGDLGRITSCLLKGDLIGSWLFHCASIFAEEHVYVWL